MPSSAGTWARRSTCGRQTQVYVTTAPPDDEPPTRPIVQAALDGQLTSGRCDSSATTGDGPTRRVHGGGTRPAPSRSIRFESSNAHTARRSTGAVTLHNNCATSLASAVHPIGSAPGARCGGTSVRGAARTRDQDRRPSSQREARTDRRRVTHYPGFSEPRPDSPWLSHGSICPPAIQTVGIARVRRAPRPVPRRSHARPREFAVERSRSCCRGATPNVTEHRPERTTPSLPR